MFKKHSQNCLVKFLFDAQLPISVCFLLKQRGYDAFHTLELPHSNALSDRLITSFSLKENRVVFTKDNDFLGSYLIHSQPKKLLLIK